MTSGITPQFNDFSIFLFETIFFVLNRRLCQLSILGASIKSITASACTFLADELSGLNKVTENMTKELTKNLGVGGGSSIWTNVLMQPKSKTTKTNSLLKF